jgi:hypothetical protein
MSNHQNTKQPPPRENNRTPVWFLVIDDMLDRDRSGRAKYGTPLQARNGRNSLMDAYQESLDQAVYLRQAIEERAHEPLAWIILRTIAAEAERTGSWTVPPDIQEWIHAALKGKR